MQGDEGAISAMGMGIHRIFLVEFKGDLYEELQHHHECFAHGKICGY